MPTSHDTEQLSTAESLQKAETPRSLVAVHQDRETPSPDFPSEEDSELADDTFDGKKAVFMVEIFKTPDNENIEPAARKQRFAGGFTLADTHESTTVPAVAESLSKFSVNAESSSQNPEDKHVSSGGQREVRSFDSNDHNVNDEDNKEDDMSVAETIIFRPLFSYRQDTAARRRYFRDVSINHPEFDYY
jgi:hypothetical protein